MNDVSSDSRSFEPSSAFALSESGGLRPPLAFQQSPSSERHISQAGHHAMKIKMNLSTRDNPSCGHELYGTQVRLPVKIER